MPYLKEVKRAAPDHPQLNLGPGVRAWPTASLSLCILGPSLGKFSVTLGSLSTESIADGMAKWEGGGCYEMKLPMQEEKEAEALVLQGRRQRYPNTLVRTTSNVQIVLL